MSDVPLLSYILQKFYYPNFLLDEFSFSLVHKEDHDVWHYAVSFEYFVTPVTVLGIDTTKHRGPLPNLDLVHFMWEHIFSFSYKKNIQVQSMTVLLKM